MTTIWIVAFAALSSLVALIGLLVLGTLRRITPLLEQAEESFQAASRASLGGLSVGSNVPPFESFDVHGTSFSREDLLGRTSFVLFLGTTCEACERFVVDLQAGRLPSLGAPLIVVPEDPESARGLARARDVLVLLDEHRAVARAFDVRIVPQAFVVDEHGGVLAAGRANDWSDLRELLAARGGGRDNDRAAATLTA